MHSEARVGPALNSTSIGRDLWKSGSANRRFLGSLISDRSMGWSGTAGDIVGIIKKVAVRVYVPSIEVRVAVICRFAMVVKLSSVPIGTEHLLCLRYSERANSSVMKFILDPVSSNALARIGCALLFRMLICAVTNRS
jgi:hypothetical protein